MVFDTLQKTLTNFTDDVTDTVLHPLDTVTNATKSMKKTVLGPETNLEEQVENKLRYVPLMQTFQKETRNLMTKITKSKLAKTKKEKVKTALQTLKSQVEQKKDFDTCSKTIKSLFNSFEKNIKKWDLPTQYTWKSWEIDKIKLNSGDINILLTLLQEAQVELNGTIADLQASFTEQYLAPCMKKYNHAEERSNFHKIWKKDIDVLIEDEYAVTKEQKSLLYTVENLKKQQKKLESLMKDKREGQDDKDTIRDIHTIKDKIKNIIQKDIPLALKAIDSKWAKIIKDEQQIHEEWGKYRNTYKAWQAEIRKWIATNYISTQKLITTNTKKRVNLIKQKQNTEKKIKTLHQKIEKLIEHINTNQQIKNTKTLFEEERELDNLYIDQVLTLLSTYTQQIKYHLKDMYIQHFSANDHTTFLYDTWALEKWRILQLKILLNIKNKHYELSNKVWHTLLEAETTSEQKFTSLINHCKRHFDSFKKQKINYEKEIGTQNDFIQKQKKEIKEIHGANEAIKLIEQWLIENNTYSLSTFYKESLETLQVLSKEYIKALETNMKSSAKKLEDMKKIQKNNKKENDLTTAKKREIKKQELDIHEYELYLDTLQGYIAHAEEEQNDNKSLIKYYTKQANRSKKKMDFYSKQATNMFKKIRKNKYFKPVLKELKRMVGTKMK